MVTVTCTRCGSQVLASDNFGSVSCPTCGLFKTPQPITGSASTYWTTFVCKACGVSVFTNAVPSDKRCVHCIAKASPPVGTPVPAPKESGEPIGVGGAVSARGLASAKPHRCPVCEGKGAMPTGFYLAPETNSTAPKQCRSCKGAGLVWG